jgi:hypothetical protein
VIVTVHRLDDAAGLEQALRAKGIDADVSFAADGSSGQYSVGDPDGAEDGQVPRGEGGLSSSTEGEGPSESGGGQSGAEPATSGPGSIAEACGQVEPPPATLTHEGEDWVLTIPAGSPLHDRHVDIGTDAAGALAVQYAANVPGAYCGVVTTGTP